MTRSTSQHATGLSRVTLARSQRQSDPDAANWPGVSCRIALRCAALRCVAVVLPHEQLPTCTALYVSRYHTAPRQCDQWPSVLALTPCVLPGFQGFTSGGRCCGTLLVPW